MLIGHQTQWEFLKQIARSNRVPQAMLFSGRDCLGKKKVALEFIKLLNCQNFWQNLDKEPCQHCFSCQNIERERHPDLILIRPQNKEIQISQIRILKAKLNLRPQISSFKSVIIDWAQTLNSEAQNCLLKTLEEPQGQAILILVTSQPEMLLPTIRSRAQILKFYPLRTQQIEEHFKEKISQTQMEKFLFFSQGLPGQAIEFFKNPEKLNLEIEKFDFVKKILESDINKRFYLLRELFKKGDLSFNSRDFLGDLIRYLRFLLWQKLGLKTPWVFSKTFKDYPLLKLKKMIETAEDLKFLISNTNINPQLALENLILNL